MSTEQDTVAVKQKMTTTVEHNTFLIYFMSIAAVKIHPKVAKTCTNILTVNEQLPIIYKMGSKYRTFLLQMQIKELQYIRKYQPRYFLCMMFIEKSVLLHAYTGCRCSTAHLIFLKVR